MIDLWFQFSVFRSYASHIRFSVNEVPIAKWPFKGIGPIFGKVTHVTTGWVWMRSILSVGQAVGIFCSWCWIISCEVILIYSRTGNHIDKCIEGVSKAVYEPYHSFKVSHCVYTLLPHQEAPCPSHSWRQILAFHFTQFFPSCVNIFIIQQWIMGSTGGSISAVQ